MEQGIGMREKFERLEFVVLQCFGSILEALSNSNIIDQLSIVLPRP